MSDKSISHAISGGLSGLVSMAVTYPLVTLSTNAQAKTTEQFEQNALEEGESNTGTEGKPSVTKLPLRTIPQELSVELDKMPIERDAHKKDIGCYKNVLGRLVRKLVQRLKFLIQHSKKFYSGLESALVGIVAVNFCYYYVYSVVGNYFKKMNKRSSLGLNVKDSLVTGLTAGVVSRVVTNPIWVANTRMTVKQKVQEHDAKDTTVDVSQQSTFKVMYEILKNEGLSGLFSGLGPALILVLSPMIQFTVFEQLKTLTVRLRQKRGVTAKNISSLEALLLGSFGKLIAILLTYPYYTIRSRMHLSSKKDNSFKVLYDVVKEEGACALYRGINAKLLQSVVSAGLVFYFKEEMMSAVGVLVNNCNAQKTKVTRCLNDIKLKQIFSKRSFK